MKMFKRVFQAVSKKVRRLAAKPLFKKTFPFGFSLLAAIFLIGSGWTHNPHPLRSVSSELLPPFSVKDRQVLVFAKAMNGSESKRSFGHDLPSRGVVPVQVTIQNNTSNEYSFCPSSIDLPRVEASKIAFKVTKSSIPRAIGFKIVSLIFWPFTIPSTIDSIRVFTHHKNLKKDLLAKSARDEIVAPYSTFHRVLFVPQDGYKNSFKVTLIELDTLKKEEFQTVAKEE